MIRINEGPLYRLCNRDWKPVYAQYWHSLLRIPTLATDDGRRKSVDLALQTFVLGVKTLHSTAEVPDNRHRGESWR